MKKATFVLAVLFFVCTVVGCDQLKKMVANVAPAKAKTVNVDSTTATKQEVKGTKLAQVNEKIITLEEFNQNIQNIKSLQPDVKIETIDDKKNLLDEMVNQELLYQDAMSRGLQNRKEVKDLADGYLRGLAVRQLLIDTTENVTVDPQEIETFYNQYKDQLSEPEQRRIREIVVATEDDARAVLIRLLQGENFASIAKEKSIGKSGASAGDIGFITVGKRGASYKKYDDIAFSLDAGQTSNVFKGPEGYCVIKVEEVKAGKSKSLTDVYDQLKTELLNLKQQQRVQELINKLKSNAKISISEELIK